MTVIIPTYKDWNRLRYCLNALAQQTLSKELFEVIVVNNDPSDDCPYPVADNVKIIKEEKAGSYAARNAGIKVAKGANLAFTDSDCIPENDWLERAAAFFTAHPEISRIAGNVVLFPEDTQNLTDVEIFDITFGFQQRRYVTRGGAVTANMITRKEVVDQVGLFNDNLFSGGDLEWGKRASVGGFPIAYADNVRVKHPARKEWEEIATKHKRFAGGVLKLKKGNVPASYYVMELLRPVKSFFHVLLNNDRKISLRNLLTATTVNYRLAAVRFKELKRLKGEDGVAVRN